MRDGFVQLGGVRWVVTRRWEPQELADELPHLVPSLIAAGVVEVADLARPGRRCTERSAYNVAGVWAWPQDVTLPQVRREPLREWAATIAAVESAVYQSEDPSALVRALGRLIRAPHGSTRQEKNEPDAA